MVKELTTGIIAEIARDIDGLELAAGETTSERSGEVAMFANTFNVHADFVRKSVDYPTECVLFSENCNVNRRCVRVCHRRDEHHPTFVESGQKRAIGSANIYLGIDV